MSGKHFLLSNKRRLWIALGLIIGLFLIVFACLFVYYWQLHPLVTRLFIPSDVYYSMDYYQNEQYLQFEDGEAFKNMLAEWQGPKQGKVTGFVYEDNGDDDHLFYGKMYDIYAIDVLLDTKEYEAEKQMAQQIAEEEVEIFAFDSYPYFTSSTKEYIAAIAFCDDTQIARYVLITETEDEECSCESDTIMRMHSVLKWDADGELIYWPLDYWGYEYGG